MSIVGRSKLDNPPLNTPGGTDLYTAFEAMLKVVSDNSAGRYQVFSAVPNNTVIPVDHNFGVPLTSLTVQLFTGVFPNYVPIDSPTPTWGIAASGTFPNTVINITTPISGGPWTGVIWITQTTGGAGGASASWSIKTANYTAVNGDAILANTAGGVFTITLPASPSVGNIVQVSDPFGNWETNNLAIAGNGSNILGSPTNLDCNVNGSKLYMVFVGGTTGWQVY